MMKQTTKLIDQLRIATDWGGSNEAIMLSTEADSEWQKQKDATKDQDNPDGWGSEPRLLDDDDLLVWGNGQFSWSNSSYVITTQAAEPIVDELCRIASEILESSDHCAAIYVVDLLNKEA